MTFATIGSSSGGAPGTGRGPWAAAELSPAQLPRADRVLAITARPGQESASLGGLLYALRSSGASVSLLSLTRGEASGLNSTLQPLEAVRPWELQLAAFLLGVSSVAVSDYPDGSLSGCELTTLTERVHRAIRLHSPGLLVVIDPLDADADSAMAAMAACAAADEVGVPVVARTLPAARGGWQVSLGAETAAARAAQRSAAAAHRSQSAGLSELMSHLDQLGAEEWLRWLIAPAGRRLVGQHPAGQHPAGQRPAGQHPAGQHPAAQERAASTGALGLVPLPRLAALRPL